MRPRRHRHRLRVRRPLVNISPAIGAAALCLASIIREDDDDSAVIDPSRSVPRLARVGCTCAWTAGQASRPSPAGALVPLA